MATTPDELAQHEVILHEITLPERGTLKLSQNGLISEISTKGRVKVDAAPGVLAAAVAGLGIANVTTVMSEQDRKEGKLVQILSEYELEPLKAFAVFPSGPRPSAKIRTLVEHLITELTFCS